MIDKHVFEQIFRKVGPESFLCEFLNSGDPLYLDLHMSSEQWVLQMLDFQESDEIFSENGHIPCNSRGQTKCYSRVRIERTQICQNYRDNGLAKWELYQG